MPLKVTIRPKQSNILTEQKQKKMLINHSSFYSKWSPPPPPSPPWSQRSVQHSFSLHIIKTGLWTSMHEMSACKWEGRPSGSNQCCLFPEHHLPRTRPQRDETQSRCLLFGNTATVSSHTPEWIPLTTWPIPHVATEVSFIWAWVVKWSTSLSRIRQKPEQVLTFNVNALFFKLSDSQWKHQHDLSEL